MRCGDELFADEDFGVAEGVHLDFHHVGGAEIVLVVEQIVDARGAVGFFPMIGEVGLVFRPDDARVGGDD